jgi:hypothetical protein
MPSAQRGTLVKRGDRWSVRWRDESGKPRRRTFGAGREGKGEAQAFLERTLREVEARRNGDPSQFAAMTSRRSPSSSTSTSASTTPRRTRSATSPPASATRPRARGSTGRAAGKTSASTG